MTQFQLMLLSLGAGGVGLNLVGANHLFLVDCHWNPQVRNQLASTFSGTTTEFCVPDHRSQAAIMVKFRAVMPNPDLFRTIFLTFPDI